MTEQFAQEEDVVMAVAKHLASAECPECGGTDSSHVGRGTHKCDKCGHEWGPHEMLPTEEVKSKVKKSKIEKTGWGAAAREAALAARHAKRAGASGANIGMKVSAGEMGSAAKHAGNAVKEAAGAYGQGAKDVIGTAGKVAGAAGKAAGQVGQAYVRGAKNTLGAAGKVAGAYVSGAKNTANVVAGGAKKVGGAYEASGKKTISLAQGAAGKIKETAGKATDFVKRNKGKIAAVGGAAAALGGIALAARNPGVRGAVRSAAGGAQNFMTTGSASAHRFTGDKPGGTMAGWKAKKSLVLRKSATIGLIYKSYFGLFPEVEELLVVSKSLIDDPAMQESPYYNDLAVSFYEIMALTEEGVEKSMLYEPGYFEAFEAVVKAKKMKKDKKDEAEEEAQEDPEEEAQETPEEEAAEEHDEEEPEEEMPKKAKK